MKLAGAIASAVIGGALLLASVSYASPWVNVVGCDTVSVNGVVYPRISFSFHNAYPVVSPEYPFCTAQLIPHGAAAPSDTCRGIATTSPAGWASEVSGDRIIYSLVDGKMSCILPGQTLAGFQVVLSKGHNCCYDLYISGNLFEPFAQDLVCFDCDLPSPARPSTWGQLKSAYR